MSYYDYKKGQELELYCAENHIPFYSIIQCSMRRADSFNLEGLKIAFPKEWKELSERYKAPGGKLKGE